MTAIEIFELVFVMIVYGAFAFYIGFEIGIHKR